MSVHQIASYGCTALTGTNKVGKIRPNADGYYTLVVGAVNTFNSAGAYYPLEPAKALFDESSSFQRRIKDGSLYGEMGHPKKMPGMSMRDFMARCMDIHETNVCCHFRKIWLESGHKDPEGRPVVAIMAEIKPAGPMGPALATALDNNAQNVCFSIRSFTHDVMQGGVLNKLLRTIVTFDYVAEPGIAIAKKWFAPGLENLKLYSEVRVSPDLINDVIEDKKAACCGMESSLIIPYEIKQALNSPFKLTPERPPSAYW